MCLPLESRGGPPASEPESSAPISQYLHYPRVRVCARACVPTMVRVCGGQRLPTLPLESGSLTKLGAH